MMFWPAAALVMPQLSVAWPGSSRPSDEVEGDGGG